MFTKLGKAGLPVLFNTGSSIFKNLPAGASTLIVTTPFKDYAGRDKNFAVPSSETYSNRYLNGAISDSTYSGIAVGSGDTPPTENDYALEAKINGLTGSVNPASVNNVVYDAENEVLNFYVDLTLTNSTSDPVTIKEIGFYGFTYYGSTIGQAPGNTRVPALIDRTLLETPVTIPAGEAAVIRYQFDIDVSVT